MHLVGLTVAALATAGILVAVLTDTLPFVAVVAVGFIGIAVLIFRDLQDGDREEVGQEATQPKIAQMKQNQKHPAHRL
ncbi:MAG TPA: hypothetical protein VFJ65_06975 [Solirubrobacterales bacterium]|nr:hypothetical protein [Solirubrobacterales bacterium]